jgi:predicted MFS family arabinose efflux permease
MSTTTPLVDGERDGPGDGPGDGHGPDGSRGDGDSEGDGSHPADDRARVPAFAVGAPTLVPGSAEIEETGLRLAPAAAVGDEPLAANRDFWTVLIGQGISSFGDAVTNTALPLLVLGLTGSGFVMGIVGVLSTLPDLVMGLPAGAYADRWSRRRMMFWADVGRATLTALVPLSVWLGGPTIAVILLVAFPINVLRVIWIAGYTAAVPGLVGRSHIARANAIFEAVFNVGWIVGPALAGILAATIGPGPTIALDAATFAVSAGAMLLVHRELRPEPRAETPHLLDDIREGVRFVLGQPTLRSVIALWTTQQVLLAGLTTALIFYITIDRGLGPSVVGVVLSAFAIGGLGGALVAARLRYAAVGRVMLSGIIVTGGLLMLVGLGVPVWLIVATAFISGLLMSNVLVSYVTLRTQLSPDALLGRIGSTARTASVGLMPIGALATGALLDAIGGTATLVLMGGAMAAAGALFALLPNVRRAVVPRPTPAAG